MPASDAPGDAAGVDAVRAEAAALVATGLVATGLVADLWRRNPPDVWTHGRRGAAGHAQLREALVRCAAAADQLAGEAPAAERPAVQLLGETARAVLTALRDHGAGPDSASVPSPDPGAGAGGTLASPVRLRLARMERWLSARTSADPSAEASVNLCLWVLEHLEADGA